MEKNFKTYIALISNRRNTDERYFIKSSRDETLQEFTKRAHTCFDNREFYVDIYEGYLAN